MNKLKKSVFWVLVCFSSLPIFISMDISGGLVLDRGFSAGFDLDRVEDRRFMFSMCLSLFILGLYYILFTIADPLKSTLFFLVFFVYCVLIFLSSLSLKFLVVPIFLSFWLIGRKGVPDWLFNVRSDFVYSVANTVVFCQLLILINSFGLSVFGQLLTDFIIVFNYQQYFSLGCCFALLMLSHKDNLSISWFLKWIICIFGGLDSSNNTGLAGLVIVPFVILVSVWAEQIVDRFFYSNDSAYKIKLTIAFANLCLGLFIPSIVALLVDFGWIDVYSLGWRAGIWFKWFSEISWHSVFIPNIFLGDIEGKPHNSFLVILESFGVLLGFLVIVLLARVLARLTVRHCFCVSFLIGIFGSMTSLLFHPYTLVLLLVFVNFGPQRFEEQLSR